MADFTLNQMPYISWLYTRVIIKDFKVFIIIKDFKVFIIIIIIIIIKSFIIIRLYFQWVTLLATSYSFFLEAHLKKYIETYKIWIQYTNCFKRYQTETIFKAEKGP